MPFVDIDIDAGSSLIVNHRADGTTTVSVPRYSLERAAALMFANSAALERNAAYEYTRSIGGLNG
ncbi:MAG TPA: hypothetical protein VGG45_16245 [Terracidiphilus sp.]|jgi:hypothetical protein